jgi:hypothetical protein
METLKLEVGKTYRNRKGEEVKIVEYDGDPEYPYRGSDGEWYTESGNLWYRERPGDLVEEVPSEPTRRRAGLTQRAGGSLTPFGESIKLLRDLADLQNGAPLEQYRKEWEETMKQVYDFLNRWEGQ